MLNEQTIACVIPARLESSRFPRKILAPLQGKPLIQWVWEAALQVPFFDEVILAIDSQETAEVIEQFGGKYEMTPSMLRSGTERLAYLQMEQRIRADIWVNWQGDEPFLNEGVMRDLLQSTGDKSIDVWTLKKRITDPALIESPHVCKVVCGADNCALYFSRSPIPYYASEVPMEEMRYFKHIGLYAYRAEALKKMGTYPPHYLEGAEKLEQLHFLAHGMKILVQTTEHESLGIDIPDHLAQAEKRLLAKTKAIL